MSWGYIAVGVGTAAAGALGANAADDAADASSDAARLGIEENSRQFDLTRRDTGPYRDVGQGALYQLANIFGVSTPSPVDTARLNELERGKAEVTQRLEDAARGRRIPGPESLKKAGFRNKDEWLASENARLKSIDTEIQNISRPAASDPARRIQPVTPNAGKSGGSATGIYGDIGPLEVKSLYENLEMDPGYEFRLSEGEKALQRQQSAGGTRYGGAALKAAARYGQDYASNEFINAANRRNVEISHAQNERSFAVNQRNAELGYLFSLAGFGPQGVATAGQAGAATAGNNANILMQNAQMQGNAAMTGASAINNAVQGGIQNYYTHNLLKNYNRNPITTQTPQPVTDWNYNY